MDTLINTAKIGLEAQIKQMKASSSDDMDGRLLTTIGQIQESVTELKDTTANKIHEESQQRLNDMTQVSKEAELRIEAVKSTFANRLNIVEKQVQNNEIMI